MRKPTRPRSKAEMAEARRGELIQATIRSIARDGIAEASVERITETAGVSRGLVRYHFRSKSELWAEAYRSLCNELRNRLQLVLPSRPADAMSQLNALIEIILQPPVFREEMLSAWYGFWHAAKTDPSLRAVNREIYGWYRDFVRGLLATAAQERGLEIDLDRATDGFVALNDGLWLELSIDPKAFKPGYGEAICKDYVAQLLKR